MEEFSRPARPCGPDRERFSILAPCLSRRPVLVDIPKDIQQMLAVPDWDVPMDLGAYISRLPPPPNTAQLQRVVEAIREVSGYLRKEHGSAG